MHPVGASAGRRNNPSPRLFDQAVLRYGRPMFEGWGEFYLLAGSAAAVLIGLIFVVMTLMQDRPRSSVLSGSKLYMGPVVLHVTFVLVLSGAALVPKITSAQ